MGKLKPSGLTPEEELKMRRFAERITWRDGDIVIIRKGPGAEEPQPATQKEAKDGEQAPQAETGAQTELHGED